MGKALIIPGCDFSHNNIGAVTRKVTLSSMSISINNDITDQGVCTIIPSPANARPNVSWSIISGNDFASIDSTGKITVSSAGQITIKAVDEETGIETIKTINVDVTPEEPQLDENLLFYAPLTDPNNIIDTVNGIQGKKYIRGAESNNGGAVTENGYSTNDVEYAYLRFDLPDELVSHNNMCICFDYYLDDLPLRYEHIIMPVPPTETGYKNYGVCCWVQTATGRLGGTFKSSSKNGDNVSDLALETGQWNKVCVAFFNGSNSDMKVGYFLNGAKHVFTECSFVGDRFGRALFIGNRSFAALPDTGSGTRSMTGFIKNVKIFKDLTEDEVLSLTV